MLIIQKLSMFTYFSLGQKHQVIFKIISCIKKKTCDCTFGFYHYF